MEFVELINGFARELGKNDLEYTGDGICELSVEGLKVSFRESLDFRTFSLCGDIGEIPEASRPELHQILLEASFLACELDASYFSLDPESERVNLNMTRQLDAFDHKGFYQLVEDFVNTMSMWRAVISEYKPGDRKRNLERKQDQIQNAGGVSGPKKPMVRV